MRSHVRHREDSRDAARRAGHPGTRPQRRAVAAALRTVAETFAEVPDGRDTAYALRMLPHMLDAG